MPIRLLRERVGDEIQIITPEAPEERGCQLSLRVQRRAEAWPTHFRCARRPRHHLRLARTRHHPHRPRAALQPLHGHLRTRRRAHRRAQGNCLSLKAAAGVNIIGAGLAGSLLAILLAKRGFKVTVYERRPDPRVATVNGGRSINLALAARGIRGLKLAGVLERVMKFAIPMRGRMVHEHDGAAALQLYGVRPDEVIYSVSRARAQSRAHRGRGRESRTWNCDSGSCASGSRTRRTCSRCATKPPGASTTPPRSPASPPTAPAQKCATAWWRAM